MNSLYLDLFHTSWYGKIEFFFNLHERERLVSDLPLMFMDFSLAVYMKHIANWF